MTLAESWMSFLRAHITTSTYAAKMAPTKHTTTGLLANVAKSSAVRETSTKFGITKKELPKKVRWLQRHWVTKGVVSGPTCQKKNNTVTGLSPVKKVWIKTMLACEYLQTLHPSSLQEDVDSFQYLHWAATDMTVMVAFMDLMPGSTIGFMTR